MRLNNLVEIGSTEGMARGPARASRKRKVQKASNATILTPSIDHGGKKQQRFWAAEEWHREGIFEEAGPSGKDRGYGVRRVVLRLLEESSNSLGSIWTNRAPNILPGLSLRAIIPEGKVRTTLYAPGLSSSLPSKGLSGPPLLPQCLRKH